MTIWNTTVCDCEISTAIAESWKIESICIQFPECNDSSTKLHNIDSRSRNNVNFILLILQQNLATIEKRASVAKQEKRRIQSCTIDDKLIFSGRCKVSTVNIDAVIAETTFLAWRDSEIWTMFTTEFLSLVCIPSSNFIIDLSWNCTIFQQQMQSVPFRPLRRLPRLNWLLNARCKLPS